MFVKEAQTSYLRMSTHKVGKQFKKMCLNKNSFNLLLILLIIDIMYIRNSLEKGAENSGVLLNW